jgi:hypothetical protein
MTRDMWLGDAARAFDAVGAHTPEARATVASLLGFDIRRVAEVGVAGRTAQTSPVPRRRASESQPEPGRPQMAEPAGEVAAQPPPTARRGRGGGGRQRVELVGYDQVGRADDAGEHLPPMPDEWLSATPDHIPLLPPASTRAVLQALLAQESLDGPVDHAALVEAASRHLLVTLPRSTVPTMRFGVQVLVDQGDGMAPFARDQVHLVQQVREVAGADRVEVRYFADAPQRGAGEGPLWTWTEYRPPAPKTRILLLSDLGIGGLPWSPGRSTRTEWESFADLARWHSCDVVAMVPFPRWPTWASGLFTVVAWDRTLTAARASVVR